MKQKIKEALKTRAKNLGLDDSAFDGVAAFGETIVKEEADIEGFVNSEATMNLLKTYQSVADKARAAAKAKNEPETKPSDNGNQPPKTDPETKPADDEKIPAWAQALIDSNKAMSEELATFKTSQAQKSAIEALTERKNTWDYAQGFPDERDDAYELAMELYEVGGKKWNADELIAKFEEKLNKAVGKRGTQSSKPFESDGGGDNHSAKFAEMAKRQEERAAGAVAE